MSKILLMKFLALIIIPFGLTKAQTAILTTGTTATGASGSTTYSVGQVAYSQKGADQEVMEGVQQAYEITTLEVDNESIMEKKILLYPNPVRDFLNVDFGKENFHNSNYVLFDSQGKLIRSGNLLQQKTELNMTELPSSVYIIQIFQDRKNIKTFKIIKK
ncbi:T9SS type A sorting domain-containing protein [Epilithonimonas ginsengisoli]|uniref:T9SS type A sorting domain-containing protein n=1 Tax=Epilithonimonas ginsengisoli TaxID=1245592 RepID=A0ABU4JCU4_9FLAO|nr:MULTISPECIES: T9SS type A sorting domain-containing protein [Chryseobacterium group]MDW8547481.1 T9SS type A sorting domain-containing protein [Epilithonimonas ginsengisoli]OAH68930.1 secretion protein [Chryseobacterium sp. FP211-J200]